VISERKFQRGKCHCDSEINSPSKVEKVSLCQIRPAVVSFYTENLWLEEGASYQFKRLNFEVMTGCNILGSSGIWHEIDVLAEDPGRNIRVGCECKNRGVGLSDIYVFNCKLRDIGITRGIIVTTSKEIHRNIWLATESNMIRVCTSALDKPEDEWKTILSD
jgi:hypothetical protein